MLRVPKRLSEPNKDTKHQRTSTAKKHIEALTARLEERGEWESHMLLTWSTARTFSPVRCSEPWSMCATSSKTVWYT